MDIILSDVAPLALIEPLDLTWEVSLRPVKPKVQIQGLTITQETDDDAFFVNGKQLLYMESTFKVISNVNGKDRASCSFLYKSGPKPQPEQRCYLNARGIRRFGGIIDKITKIALPGQNTYVKYEMDLSGYGYIFDDIIVHKLYTLPIGGLPGIILYDIWKEHLQPRGVLKFGDAGPNVVLGEILFHYITGTEVINQLLSRSPGWSIWIDENNVLRFEQTSGITPNAGFSISEGSANWDTLNTTVSRRPRRNRVWVLPSKDMQGSFTEIYTASAGQTAFPTVYNQNTAPTVIVDGVKQVIAEQGNAVPGRQFYYVPNGIGVFADVAMTGGEAVSIVYQNPFPIATMSEDPVAIAADGLKEMVYHAKNADDLDTAQALGDGLLTMYREDSEDVSLKYNEVDNSIWIKPGKVVGIELASLDLTGGYTCESVTYTEQEDSLWRIDASLRKGAGSTSKDQQIAEMLVNSRGVTNTIPVRLTAEFGKSSAGVTTTGLLPDYWVIPVVLGGVRFKDWDLSALKIPVTGSDLIIDFLVNGSSVFAAGDRPRIPVGSTTVQRGYNLLAPDTKYVGGEMVEIQIIQVGVAKYIVFHMNLRA